tara:strand:+ start:208 stop:408 length:201 start_codon:yes stop_codon:yes gene_type:complete
MITWQDKRINAMNRVIKRSGLSRIYTEHFIDEYDLVINSKSKNKKEYKLERKKKDEKTNSSNVSSD